MKSEIEISRSVLPRKRRSEIDANLSGFNVRTSFQNVSRISWSWRAVADFWCSNRSGNWDTLNMYNTLADPRIDDENIMIRIHLSPSTVDLILSLKRKGRANNASTFDGGNEIAGLHAIDDRQRKYRF